MSKELKTTTRKVSQFSAVYTNSAGKKKMALSCPYCGCLLYIYMRSFPGTGKNCGCGAKIKDVEGIKIASKIEKLLC